MNVSLSDKLSVLPGAQQLINIPKSIYYLSKTSQDIYEYWQFWQSARVTQSMIASLIFRKTELLKDVMNLSTLFNDEQSISKEIDSIQGIQICLDIREKLQKIEELEKNKKLKILQIINTTSEKIKEIDGVVREGSQHITKFKELQKKSTENFLEHTISLGDAVQRSLPVVGTIYSITFWSWANTQDHF